MTKAGDLVVHCCTKLNRIPSLIGCFLLIVLQDCCIDYYLVLHLGIEHLFWAVGDVIVLILFVLCFLLTSTSSLAPQRIKDHGQQYTVLWITWLLGQVLLVAKIIVICSTFSTDLEESGFFGPNTLKTTIALGSCIFVLFVMSQHDWDPGSERRRYVEELTGTVVFDILDTADILDVLFDADDRVNLSSGLPETIMAVAALNLLLPTVPLVTLSRTRFGLKKLSRRWVYMHRLFLVLAVNVPNLIVRMVLWHGFSVGISPFTLKNIIIIMMTAFEFYEHKKEKFEEHEKEAAEEGMVSMVGGDSNGNELGKFHDKRYSNGNDVGKYGDGPDRRSRSETANSSNSSSRSSSPEFTFGLESRMVTSM